MAEVVYHPERITRPLVRKGLEYAEASGALGGRSGSAGAPASGSPAGSGSAGSGSAGSGSPAGTESPAGSKPPTGGRSGSTRESFREAGWDEALDLVARKLSETKERHGPASVISLGGSGACRGVVHNTERVPRRFFSFFGGFTDTVGAYSNQASDFVKPFMYGTRDIGIDVKTLFDSQLLILWGFNPADTRFGPETEAGLHKISDRGTPIVVIDPRRSRTVRRFRARRLPIYPGTDAALMLALLGMAVSTGRVDRDYIEARSTGFAELEDHLLGRDGSPPKTAEWAAGICGLPAGHIRDFAELYFESRPAALLTGFAPQRNLGGEDADRLAGVLQLALGNAGVSGGSAGSGQWNALPSPRCERLPVPPNPAGSEVPVYTWADQVLSGRPIHFIYNVGGNYLVQGSDIRKNINAFDSVDFVVTHDLFFTDTARHSDVILPVTTFLERRDVLRSNTNYLFYSEQAIEPVGESRNDYDIFAGLAERLGFPRDFTGGLSADQWLDRCIEASEVTDKKEFRKTGIYAGCDQKRIALADFITDPDSHQLGTPSGRIEIADSRYQEGGGNRIPTAHPGENLPDFPLRMITPHERLRNNSQFENIPAFRKGIDGSIWINPADAGDRNIRDGEIVWIESPNGNLEGTCRVTEDIMPGVVSCSQGGWLNEPNPAVNHLSSTKPTLPSHGSRTHSIRVQVKKA
ncbi:MAG: molybdopterin-dependent oxidoreductase [Spirochaetales bacterium]|nr:molybdopterin-dependent oxidoreductase [Spirochaetales bacterium]MCF7938095.1 molybdopterin-dependent oxidoreductase [Spirochaetales bacterium]